MNVFARPQVAMVLAAVGLYAAMLSAQLEDAFRVSGPAVERVAGFRLARVRSAADMGVAGFRRAASWRSAPDTGCAPAAVEGGARGHKMNVGQIAVSEPKEDVLFSRPQTGVARSSYR